jgi:hypothetical protein
LAFDQGHRRGNGTALEDILRLREIDLGSSSHSEPTGEDVVLHVGDLVLVRDDEEFVVVRVSRPQPANRVTPRSFVFGHQLEETAEELYVYNNVGANEIRVQFSKLLQSDGCPLIVDRAAVAIALRGGALSIKFSEAMLDIIDAAIHEDDANMENEGQEEKNESTDEEERQDRDREKERARLASIGQLHRNLRSRTPSAKMCEWHAST